MNKRWLVTIVTVCVLSLSGFVPNKGLLAQDILSLEIEPSNSLQNAQVLNLNALGINKKNGRGPALVSAFLENKTDQKLENLYLEIEVRASKIGTLLELKSDSRRPFSMSPYQSVYATNNDLEKDRIPGIKERLKFNGGLTPEGDDFLTSLSGSSTLPRDTYSVEVVVFSVTDADGRQDLARAVTEVGGGSIIAANEADVYLKSPGDVVGSETEISNPYPQFSWEGPNNMSYRLIVVEANGTDSPESLIQSAKSSNPTTDGGSLLAFENLDVEVKRNTYQYPASGAQALESGKTYYWTIVTTLKKSGDSNELMSEIWGFKLMSTGETVANVPTTNEVKQAMIQLLGGDQFSQLQREGFTLEGFSYDGLEYTGPAATAKLEEILQKIRDKELVVEKN